MMYMKEEKSKPEMEKKELSVLVVHFFFFVFEELAFLTLMFLCETRCSLIRLYCFINCEQRLKIFSEI